MRTLTYFSAYLFVSLGSYAQEQQALYWQNCYLPDGISLRFNTNLNPTVLLDSCPNFMGGYSYTISNAGNGQVEFSINADSSGVLDKIGNPIAGGTAFIDRPTTWVVPHPGDPSQYYLFRTWYTTTYSLLDLDLNSGSPGFVPGQYLVPLATDMLESCAILSAPDGLDHWLVLHHPADSTFHVFDVNAGAGLNTTPVIQAAGPALPLNTRFKTSPDNTRISATFGAGTIMLFDFDPDQGLINAHLSVQIPGGLVFGTEFSPNSQLLYAFQDLQVDSAHFLQFNISQWDAAFIENSVVRLDPNGFNSAGLAGIQLAPNGRIYATLDGGPSSDPQHYQQFLAVINNPNVVGSGCQLDTIGFDLGRMCTFVPFLSKVHWFSIPMSALEEWFKPTSATRPSLHVNVCPNPVINDFMVEVDHSLTSSALVELIAPTGQVAWSAKWKAGYTNRFSIPELAVGSYTLMVTAPDGSIGKTRIVVMR